MRYQQGAADRDAEVTRRLSKLAGWWAARS